MGKKDTGVPNQIRYKSTSSFKSLHQVSLFVSFLKYILWEYITEFTEGNVKYFFLMLFIVKNVSACPQVEKTPRRKKYFSFIDTKLSWVVTKIEILVSVKLYTAKNPVISSNFLVWKFFEKAQFPHSFGRIARNHAETVPFHNISTPENYVKLRDFLHL